MATITSKRKQSTTVIAPSAPEQAQEKPKRVRRKRKPQYPNAEGKPARGLLSPPADYNPNTHRLTRGQFASMAGWYSFCAEQAQRRAERYAMLAVEAEQHPERFGRVGRVKKLQGKIAALEAMLKAKGFSAEEIAELTAE